MFEYWINDPERYGVAEFDKEGNCLSIMWKYWRSDRDSRSPVWKVSLI